VEVLGSVDWVSRLGRSRTSCQRTLQILEAVGSASISSEHSVIPLRWSTMPPCKHWGATKEGACSSWVWALG